MDAKLKEILPQEGTSAIGSGESFPEQNSGCPTYSGGGTILQPQNQHDNSSNNNKKLIQQAFHPSLFFRTRSSSLGSSTSTNPITETNTQNNYNENSCQPPTWQRIPTERNPKRKKLSNSPPPNPSTSNNSCNVSTSNRFSTLPIDLTEETEKEYAQKPSKPPPIILYGIEDLSKLSELLNQAAPHDSYTYKVINRNQLRIMTSSTEVYKTIIDLIRKNGLIGHTFTPKESRCYRIVIKNLHYTTPKEAIVEEIEKTGNSVRGEVICAQSSKNKMPLNMFFVNLEPSSNNAKVKDIEYIYKTKIKIEDPRKTKEIPQCTRCQQYGHTKNNCMRPFRCVKCAEGHRTTDCPKKDRNTPATCTLCHGSHPANYKGCQVYKEIRARKMGKMGNNKIPQVQKEKSKTNTQALPFDPHDFPPLRSNRQPTLDTGNDQHKKFPTTESKTPTCWDVKFQSTQAQPTNLLEQIIIKQSEKIDLLIQQIGTLMSLLSTIVAQYKK